jgi:micrococcal nuclease
MSVLKPFTFKAQLDHVWDGDTIWLEIQRGEGWKNTGKYRLYGVDTPEVRGKGVTAEEKVYAEEAKEFVATLLLLQSEMIVSTLKGKSKYDWMVEIWVQEAGREEYLPLADLIVEFGHGVIYEGGTKLSWPERKVIQDMARALKAA